MKAKGVRVGKGGRTFAALLHLSLITEPRQLQFSLNNALHVCKSVIYHSFVALFHLEIFFKKKGLAGHLFLYLKVALMNNKVLLNLSCEYVFVFFNKIFVKISIFSHLPPVAVKDQISHKQNTIHPALK